MTRYRVLVVTNLWPHEADPGFGSFVQAQMESLRPLGVEYEVLFINGRESRRNYWRAVGELRLRLRGGRYDLVHAHFGLSGLVARCQLRTPIVISFMGDDVLGQPRADGSITPAGHFYRLSSFLLARVASQVIVKSAEMKRRLGLASAHVIPNGVDLEFFCPMPMPEARRALGISPEKRLVLFPYDPQEPRKRFDLIEVAVRLARREIPSLEILHARGVPRLQMPLYMNAADVFVLASLFEGSPNAVKEAMAVNLPVIAVDVGDVRALISGCDGCAIVPRDPQAMSAKIVEFCRRGARSSGRERILPLSIQTVAKQIVDVYRAALAT